MNITLRELLAGLDPQTDCEIWLNEYLGRRYWPVMYGTADEFLTGATGVEEMLDCKVYSQDTETGKLRIQLADDE